MRSSGCCQPSSKWGRIPNSGIEIATLVLYSDDDVRDAQAWANLAARGHRRAYVLNGGMDAWMDEVMDPALHGDSADYVAALSRYFGGVPRKSDTHARDSTGELGETRRRGC